MAVTLLGAALGYAAPPGRYERHREPWRLLHPLAELTALGLAVACVVVFGASWRAAAAVVFCIALVVVTTTDLEFRVVPNRVVLPASVLVLALRSVGDPSPQWIVAACAASGFLFALALVNPAGIGMGDVKLTFLMGAMLGRSVLLACVVGMIAALVPALAILLRHGKAGRTMGFPYAPFLALGSVVALFL
jgi:prepilin signal peptidase PulO-like enzyme (type II secretory pathway)